jgi:hypothetical protein
MHNGWLYTNCKLPHSLITRDGVLRTSFTSGTVLWSCGLQYLGILRVGQDILTVVLIMSNRSTSDVLRPDLTLVVGHRLSIHSLICVYIHTIYSSIPVWEMGYRWGVSSV